MASKASVRLVCRPDWCNRISIVSCKWVYDCIRQWQILPAGMFCSLHALLSGRFAEHMLCIWVVHKHMHVLSGETAA